MKRMADAAPSLRDRAMIWVGFQGGMNPAEVCRLDVGGVKRQLEEGEHPICIEKTRKKTYQDYETWIHREAVEALKNYQAERERKEGELDPDDPLFVKHSVRKGDRRLTEDIVRKVMREVRDGVGEDIEKVRDRLDQQTNPLAFKFLRRAFGIACDNADVPSKYKDYWLGHAPPYNGAYQGLTKKKQREKYQQLAAEINATSSTTRGNEGLIEAVEEVIGEKFGEIGAALGRRETLKTKRETDYLRSKIWKDLHNVASLAKNLDIRNGKFQRFLEDSGIDNHIKDFTEMLEARSDILEEHGLEKGEFEKRTLLKTMAS